MQRYTTELSKKSRTFVPDMETKIETTNTGGKVLALDGEELVGRLEFSFDGNVMSIDHTYAFKKGMGICCIRFSFFSLLIFFFCLILLIRFRLV